MARYSLTAVFNVMRYFCEHEEAYSTDLMKACDLSYNHVYHLLKDLEQDGELVSEMRNGPHMQRKYFRLSDKARAEWETSTH